MIRCLFIGGCKHSQVLPLPGSCISGPESKDIEANDNLTPWEVDYMRESVSEDGRETIRISPARRGHRYRAYQLRLATWQSAWVYVLVGIGIKDVELVYLTEPGLYEKLRRTAF
jgi:hypothetical protein